MRGLLRSWWTRAALAGLAGLGLTAIVAGAWTAVRPAAPTLTGGEVSGLRVLYRTVLRPDAPAVSTPPVASEDGDWRVTVSGALDFAYTGQRLTPDLLVEQGLLDLGPGHERLLGRTTDGRWVFALPAGLVAGEGLRPRLNPDPLVREYLLTPTEVQRALTGSLSVDVMHRGAVVVGLAAATPALEAGLLLSLPALLLLLLSFRREPEPPPGPTAEEVAAQQELAGLEALLGAPAELPRPAPSQACPARVAATLRD